MIPIELILHAICLKGRDRILVFLALKVPGPNDRRGRRMTVCSLICCHVSGDRGSERNPPSIGRSIVRKLRPIGKSIIW